jgi:hypothetical protein
MTWENRKDLNMGIRNDSRERIGGIKKGGVAG